MQFYYQKIYLKRVMKSYLKVQAIWFYLTCSLTIFLFFYPHPLPFFFLLEKEKTLFFFFLVVSKFYTRKNFILQAYLLILHSPQTSFHNYIDNTIVKFYTVTLCCDILESICHFSHSYLYVCIIQYWIVYSNSELIFIYILFQNNERM